MLASAHIAPWSLLLILRNFTSQLLNCCELEIDHSGTTYSGKKTKANSTNRWIFLKASFPGHHWIQPLATRWRPQPLVKFLSTRCPSQPAVPRAFIQPWFCTIFLQVAMRFLSPAYVHLPLDSVQCVSPVEALAGPLFPAPLQKARVPWCPGLCVLNLQEPEGHALFTIHLLIPMLSTLSGMWQVVHKSWPTENGVNKRSSHPLFSTHVSFILTYFPSLNFLPSPPSLSYTKNYSMAPLLNLLLAIWWTNPRYRQKPKWMGILIFLPIWMERTRKNDWGFSMCLVLLSSQGTYPCMELSSRKTTQELPIFLRGSPEQASGHLPRTLLPIVPGQLRFKDRANTSHFQ